MHGSSTVQATAGMTIQSLLAQLLAAAQQIIPHTKETDQKRTLSTFVLIILRFLGPFGLVLPSSSSSDSGSGFGSGAGARKGLLANLADLEDAFSLRVGLFANFAERPMVCIRLDL
jgi:hypothetical protein